MSNNTANINWLGAYTLYMREVRRFLKVYHQTLIAPAVTSMIFLAIFVLALGDVKSDINGVEFKQFMGYGLIIMTMVQNAFANTSSSLIMSKVIGYIIDILTPPLSSKEIIIAYSLGALTRALLTGIIVAFSFSFFIEYSVHHAGLLVFYSVFSCLLLAQLGIFSGIAANTFDQSAAITSYIITPLSFLSGTFYSVERLPAFLKMINQFNPFFYMIDGFRYSLTNHADSNIEFGVGYLIFINIALFFLLDCLFRKGWRIKS
jgi:ABC-2 type transport system permease protein